MKTAAVIAFCFMGAVSFRALATDETHTKAVREFFRILEVDKMTDAGLDSSVEILAGQTDQPEKAKPKIEKFLRDTVGFKVIEDDMVKLYKKHFSEEEMQDLLKFYKTPTGKKMAKLQPVLFKEGAAIGQSRMMKRQDDLQKIMEEFKKK